jgi:alanyl-tRNA synthetase
LSEEKKFAHALVLGLQALHSFVNERPLRELSAYLSESGDLADRRFVSETDITREGENTTINQTITPESAIAGVHAKYPPAEASLKEVKIRQILSAPKYMTGGEAFALYETYGIPLDFIRDVCRDEGIRFSEEGFDSALQAERERARASWKGVAKQTANPLYRRLWEDNNPNAPSDKHPLGLAHVPEDQHPRMNSVFEGYLQTRSEDCEVLAIIKNGQGVQELKPGEDGEVILDHTPFYAESGGQVGDRGYLYSHELNAVVAEVKGCYYPVQGVRAHQVVVKSPRKSAAPPFDKLRAGSSAKNAEGWGTRHSEKTVPRPSPSGEGGSFDFSLRVGDKVDAVVDTSIREATMRNHTATHLLHAGLREVLGKHVKQAGSLVAPNHLRFDFSHFTAVEDEELQDIEDLINKEVLHNEKVEVIENVPIDVAVNEYKAMALFGEKYGDRVRVIKIGDFSTELCGGTHTGATGEIGLIKILKEGSVSSGVRRVEAITGEGSLRHFRKDHELEKVVKSLARIPEDMPLAAFLRDELNMREEENERLQRELDQVRMKQASSSTAHIGEKIKDVRGVKVLAHRVDDLERPQMRTLVDQLREKLGSGVVVLGSATNGNVALIVGVTKDLTSRIQAGKVIGPVAQKVGGKGGGRSDIAEAGGKDPAALDAALSDSYGVVESLLGS